MLVVVVALARRTVGLLTMLCSFQVYSQGDSVIHLHPSIPPFFFSVFSPLGDSRILGHSFLVGGNTSVKKNHHGGVPVVAPWKRIRRGTFAGKGVGSIPGLAQGGGKDPAGSAVSCGVGRRRGSDPTWLCLWRRPAAVAPIQPLAWELPYATRAALKSRGGKRNHEGGGEGSMRRMG